MEELGAPEFLGLKTSRAFYEPDPEGESGSMNWTKVVVGGQKSNFCLLIQSAYNLTVGFSHLFFSKAVLKMILENLNQEVSGFQSCSCIIEVHCTKIVGSQSFSVWIHLYRGDRSVLQFTDCAWSSWAFNKDTATK